VEIAPTILDFADAHQPRRKMHVRSFRNVLGESEPTDWDEVYASHTFHEITMYYPMRVVRSGQYKLIWNVAHPLPFPFAADLFRSATWQDVLPRGGDFDYGQRTVKAYTQRPEFELYDLVADPNETRNLAEDAQHAQKLAELQGKLRAFQERTADPWRLKWERE
jgi:N-sulfoglucosamine sulfohydrolase